MTYYEAMIAIHAEELARLPSPNVLTSGMPAEELAETAHRAVLDYLFKPLLDQKFHTFREN